MTAAVVILGLALAGLLVMLAHIQSRIVVLEDHVRKLSQAAMLQHGWAVKLEDDLDRRFDRVYNR